MVGLILCAEVKLFAHPFSAPSSIQINLETRSASLIVKNIADQELQEIWRKACGNLFEKIKVGSGPFGVGLFSSFNCRLDGTIIFGEEMKSPWLMTVRIEDESLKLLLTCRSEEINLTSEILLNIVNFPALALLELFPRQDFVSRGALGLLEQLPAAGMIESSAFAKMQDYAVKDLDNNLNLEILSLPFYDMKLKNSIWETSLLGIAKAPKASSNNPEEKWLIDRTGFTEKTSSDAYIMFHFGKGPGTLKSKVTAELQKIIEANKKQVNVMYSSYLDLRFGIQSLTGNEVVNNAKALSFTGHKKLSDDFEFRANHQNILKTSFETDGNNSYFSSQKTTLNLSYKLYEITTNLSFNIIPALGIYTLKAAKYLPQQDDGTVSFYEFDFSNLISVGSGLDAELNFSDTFCRMWINYDFAFKANQKFKTAELGLEGVYRFGAGQDAKPFYEKMTAGVFYIYNRGVAERSDAGFNQALKIETGFAGVGIGFEY